MIGSFLIMVIYFNVGASGDVNVRDFCQSDVTNSACVQSAADAAKGNRLYFTAGSYQFQNIKISTGTEVFFENGVSINFPKGESIGNYNSYFLVENSENISFVGNGSLLEGQVSDYSVMSRGFYINGSKNIQIDGFKINNFHTDTRDRKHNPDGSDWGAGI
ncbi:hypothetical protein K0A96_02235, partial [Patescibacteria group bacterium]|nr:hypothetical protein [Patescibacteria group bacterium]